MKQYRDTSTGRYVKAPSTRNQELMDELNKAFVFFNKKYANGELPPCIITIQNNGRAKAYGWFSYGRWSDSVTKKGVPEINISAEYTNRGRDEILGTLLHEMAHYWNAERDIRDCSGSQYHNKHFKTAAEMFGLKVERMKSKGWAWTTLTEDAVEAIKELNPNEDVFRHVRRRPDTPVTEKRYTSLIVNTNVGELVKCRAESCNMSQRDFVEKALMTFIDG